MTKGWAEFKKRALSVECPFCKAVPGESCKSQAGRNQQVPHRTRSAQAALAGKKAKKQTDSRSIKEMEKSARIQDDALALDLAGTTVVKDAGLTSEQTSQEGDR